MKIMKKTIFIIILLSVVPAAIATERLVPSQYPTIQAAIYAADNGDAVIIEAGTYLENLNFIGKAITVRSSNPANFEIVKNTIIDGQRKDCCVVFRTGESGNSVLEGLTLTNGGGTYVDYSYNNGMIEGEAGGGILCLNSSPTIRHCNITGNGLRESYSSITRDGRVPGPGGRVTTTPIHCGGGIALIGNCRAIIENCIVINNEADYGPGIIIRGYMPEQATSTISNCTVVNNWSEHRDPAYEIDCWDMRPLIYNTIIWGDRSLLIADPSLVTYSCVGEVYLFEGDYDEFAEPFDLAGTGGNISQNPLFVMSSADSEEGDYHLLQDSPCINAGDPDFAGNDKLDIDGQSRVMGGRIDIGADEVVLEIHVTKPAGGEVWTSGSTHEIKWSGRAGGVVDILLSTNGGADWQTIEKSIPNTGKKLCALPETVDSRNCLISVIPGIPDPSVIYTRSGFFTINPYSPGAAVESKWKSLGGDFARTGLSDSNGPESGCIKWQFETSNAVSASVTVGVDNRVYIPCEDGKLYVLDPNGSLIWSYNANSPLISSPTIGPDGTVYVGSMNGSLHAIDIYGNLLWTHSTEGFVYSSPAVSAAGNIYVGSQDGVLYALGADGSELWSFGTKGPGEVQMGSILASPTIGADETIYISGLYDPNLYALDPIDGSIKWTCNFEFPLIPDYPEGPSEFGWPFVSPVIAQDGTIYQTLLYDSNMYAINSNNGDIIWSTDLKINCAFADSYINSGSLPPIDQIKENCDYWIQFPTEIDTQAAYMRYRNSSIWSEPALGPDGTIYVSFDDPYLRAVDPNGSIKWVTDLGVVGGFTLTVGKNGLIYAAGDDGFLYVVDSDGWEVARFSSSNWLNYPVIAQDSMIIISDGRDDSLMTTDSKNAVRAIGLDGCDGQTYDLQWIEDLDADGNVDFTDLALLADNWLDCTVIDRPYYYEEQEEEEYLTGDIDRDRYVFFSDLVLLAERWLGSSKAPKGPIPTKSFGPPPGWPKQSQQQGPPIDKGRTCFLPDTPVWVNGELVHISDAVSGQIVGKLQRERKTSFSEQIEKIEEHEGVFECYDVFLQTGNCISVADSHYFMADCERWIRVQDLKEGSRLKSLNGPVSIARIIKRKKPHAGKCYNLKIKGTDRYFVGKAGVIVRDW